MILLSLALMFSALETSGGTYRNGGVLSGALTTTGPAVTGLKVFRKS